MGTRSLNFLLCHPCKITRGSSYVWMIGPSVWSVFWKLPWTVKHILKLKIIQNNRLSKKEQWYCNRTQSICHLELFGSEEIHLNWMRLWIANWRKKVRKSCFAKIWLQFHQIQWSSMAQYSWYCDINSLGPKIRFYVSVHFVIRKRTALY